MDKTSLRSEAFSLMKTTTEALSALKDIITAMSTDGRRHEQYDNRRRERSPIRRDNWERSPIRRDNWERSPIRRDNRGYDKRPYRSPNWQDNYRNSIPAKKIFRRKDKDLLKIVLKKTTAVPSVKSPPHSPSYSPTSPSYCPTSPIWIPESMVPTEEPVSGEAILDSVIGWEPCT